MDNTVPPFSTVATPPHQSFQPTVPTVAVQPTTPVTPPAPAVPTQPVTPPADPNAQPVVSLADLFPATPTPPAQPAAPVQPFTPSATPPAPAVPPVQSQAPADPNAAPATPAQPVAPTPPAYDPNVVTQQVQQGVDTLGKTIQRQAEVQTFLQSEDGKIYAPYAQQIMQVATNPKYVNYKLDRIIGFTLTPAVLLKIGADIAKSAATTTNANRTGGNGGAMPADRKAIDFSAMDSSQFKQYQEAALAGRFVQKK